MIIQFHAALLLVQVEMRQIFSISWKKKRQMVLLNLNSGFDDVWQWLLFLALHPDIRAAEGDQGRKHYL